MPVISISNGQREPLPWANWQATVYHGLPADIYRFHPESGSYLAFLGRISPEKRVDRAIEIAKQVGMPLKIAAKIDLVDQDYFESEIAPLLSNSLVEFVGEIDDDEKHEFLGNAYALLFPIDWPEPFGLVMIEAMACGTPVIAYRGGAVPELVEPGRTGFIVEGLENAVEAVRHVAQLRRKRCREVFEQRFTATRMAHDYLQQFERLIAKDKKFRRPRNGKGRSDSYPERVLHSFLFSARGRAHTGFKTGRHVRCFRSIWRCRYGRQRRTRAVLPGHTFFVSPDLQARHGPA